MGNSCNFHWVCGGLLFLFRLYIFFINFDFFYIIFRFTHGYMAPEVLSKGTAYDSSADWFSFGCMLYKLLKGHSPFRQHKTKDKHEIDRMTLTMVILRFYFILKSFCI